MKIVFILSETYGTPWVKEFNDRALKENIEVEFWCVGNLYYSNFIYDETLDRGEEIKSVFVKNWFELINLLLREQRGNIYIFGTLGLGRRNYLIQLLIRIVKGKICWVASGNGTGDMKRVCQLPERSIWDYIPPDVFFVSHKGYCYVLPSINALNTWNIQYTGTANFDKYLQTENKGIENIVNGKYAVFCDENLCHHIETELEGVRWIEDKEKYYTDCNRLFERIEEEFGIDIVIALHPSVAHNKKEGETFKPEKKIVGKTIELIKNAEFVILYACTSIDYAILYDKPVLYYTNYDLEKCNQNLLKGEFAKSYVEKLNAKYLFLDCLDENERICDYLCYDKELYKEYINNECSTTHEFFPVSVLYKYQHKIMLFEP